MIHPSYVDLMKVVNKGVEEGEEPIISSRYSIVMATARRARQLVAGDDPLIDAPQGRKALSVAVSELNEDKIRILTDEEKASMEERRLAESQKGSADEAVSEAEEAVIMEEVPDDEIGESASEEE